MPSKSVRQGHTGSGFCLPEPDRFLHDLGEKSARAQHVSDSGIMATLWHYIRGGNQYGPVTSSHLKAIADARELDPSDLVCKDGTKRWVQAGKVNGLFSDYSTPPPLPSSTAPATATLQDEQIILEEFASSDAAGPPLNSKEATPIVAHNQPPSTTANSIQLPPSSASISADANAASLGAEAIEEQWFLTKADRQTRPASFSELMELVDSGHLQRTDHVRQKGTEKWITASLVPGLFAPMTGTAEPTPLPVRTAESEPNGHPYASNRTKAEVDVKRKAADLRQAVIDCVLSKPSELADIPAIQEFWAAYSNVENEISGTRQRIERLLQAKAEYEQAESALQERSQDLSEAEAILASLYYPLGKAAFEAFLAGHIKDHAAFASRWASHSAILKLQIEREKLAASPQAGLVEKGTAAAKQLMVAGRIKLQERKLKGLEIEIGKQLIAAYQEESVRCDSTASVLAQIADARNAVAECRKQQQKVCAVIEAEKAEICKTFDMERFWDAEVERCRQALAQQEHYREVLLSELPDKLLVDTSVPTTGQLGGLLTELDDVIVQASMESNWSPQEVERRQPPQLSQNSPLLFQTNGLNLNDRPRDVRNAVILLYVSLGIGLLQITLTSEALYESTATLGQDTAENATRLIVIVGFFVLAISWFFIHMIYQGRDWARITYLVLFVIGLPFFFMSVSNADLLCGWLGVGQALVQLRALWFLFQPPSNAWFRKVKARRLHILLDRDR